MSVNRKNDIPLRAPLQQDNHGGFSPHSIRIAVLCLLLTGIVFVFDTVTPLGVANGMLYILVILLSWFTRSNRLIYWFAGIAILLEFIGFFQSESGVMLWIALLNRSLSVFSITVTAYILSRMLIAQRERERAERSVMDLNQRLRQSNESLEEYAHMVSHDLRAPLRSIKGFGEFLNTEYGTALDETGRDYLGRIITNAGRMDEMITALLNLSKLTRGELQMQRTDLGLLARAVVEELRTNDPGRSIRVVIRQDLQAFCDPQLMSIVLQNLLGNAWKFTKNTPDPVIEFGKKHENGDTIFFICDNGAGFDDRFKDKLFNLFQRLHSEKEFEGTGMGLVTVKRIVERHRGRIWAEGHEGKGACFYFTLSDAL